MGKRIPWPGVVHGCYRGSRPATAAAAAMLATHNYKRTWSEAVAAYIALSDFARESSSRAAFRRRKSSSNLIFQSDRDGRGKGNYALFVGRLTPEKGISTLLEAWRELGRELPLQIAGDGPMAPEVGKPAGKRHVSWLKWLPRAEILQKMKDASLLVLPSTWYEGFPMILAEAFAVGLPVIASDLGSMSSIVDHRRTACTLSPAARATWWRRCVISRPPRRSAFMRAQARREYEGKYTGERNYARLIDIYESVLPPKFPVVPGETNELHAAFR